MFTLTRRIIDKNTYFLYKKNEILCVYDFDCVESIFDIFIFNMDAYNG